MRPCSPEESEQWLREFCDTHDCPDYETVMKAIKGDNIDFDEGYRAHGIFEPYEIGENYFHFTGYDAHAAIPPEFWQHVENVLGRKVAFRPGQFTCSC